RLGRSDELVHAPSEERGDLYQFLRLNGTEALLDSDVRRPTEPEQRRCVLLSLAGRLSCRSDSLSERFGIQAGFGHGVPHSSALGALMSSAHFKCRSRPWSIMRSHSARYRSIKPRHGVAESPIRTTCDPYRCLENHAGTSCEDSSARRATWKRSARRVS